MKIIDTVRTHIPANPGWYLLEPVHDSAKLGQRNVIEIERLPIIGWLFVTTVLEDDFGGEYESSTSTSPITESMSLPLDTPYAIEAPCGNIRGCDGSSFTERKEVLDYLREECAIHDAHILRIQNKQTNPNILAKGD